jgi:hypothetical protein
MSNTDPLAGIVSAWFTKAKSWWGASTCAQAVTAMVAAIAVLVERTPSSLALSVALISIAGSGGIWRSERIRQRAEALLRHVELADAFGWEVDPKVLSDALIEAIPDESLAASRGHEQGSFFSSRRPPGPERALENLGESAWWTQHLAETMGRIAVVGTILLFFLTLYSLVIAAAVVGGGVVTVSAVVTAVVALIFAATLVRLPFDYLHLAGQARSFDEKASALLRSGDASETQALRLLADYQLTRATSVLIPDWVWRSRRSHLNRTWAVYRKYRS